MSLSNYHLNKIVKKTSISSTSISKGLRCNKCGIWYCADPSVLHYDVQEGEQCGYEGRAGPNPDQCSPEHPCRGTLVLDLSYTKEMLLMDEVRRRVRGQVYRKILQINKSKHLFPIESEKRLRLLVRVLLPKIADSLDHQIFSKYLDFVFSMKNNLRRLIICNSNITWKNIAEQMVETGLKIYSTCCSNRIEQLKTMPYNEYLLTGHWQEMRIKSLNRANRKCQLCSDATNLNVHHNTYKTRGFEYLSDLTVLCKRCHSRHHGKKE